ncbi:MAG: LysR family transcriptional regulator [Lachnospiraceae bacterium]
MNAEKLRVLMCVLETGSLSGAAEKLGYTPSGVSRMMEALEEETGLSLLVRRKSGAAATDTLQALLPDIRAYLQMDETLEGKFALARGSLAGTVRVGNAYYGMYPGLERAVEAFGASYPAVTVSLLPGITQELLEKLDRGEIDLAITTLRAEKTQYHWKKIGEDEMVAWVPEGRLKEDERMTAFPIRDFASLPYIDLYPGMDTDNRRILKKAGVAPKVRMSTYDSYAAWTMVEAGLGVAMNSRLNSAFQQGSVRVLPLVPKTLVSIGIAWKEEPGPAARRFLDFCGERLMEQQEK